MNGYRQYPPPPRFSSDGCTVPRILKPLYAPYSEACRWHDWARRHLVYYGVLTVKEADWQFRLYLRDLGAWKPLLQITWLVVKWTRNRYSATLPVSSEDWLNYVFRK